MINRAPSDPLLLLLAHLQTSGHSATLICFVAFAHYLWIDDSRPPGFLCKMPGRLREESWEAHLGEGPQRAPRWALKTPCPLPLSIYDRVGGACGSEGNQLENEQGSPASSSVWREDPGLLSTEARSRLCVCRASFLMTFVMGGVPHAGSRQ